MLSINTIARVVVNTVRTAASPASFDTGLLLVKDSGFVAANRLQIYDSVEEATAGLSALGFGSSSEPYKAAVKYFAASPAPSRLMVSSYRTSESMSEAIDAVLDLSSSFYGVLPCDANTTSGWLTFAQHVEALSVPLMLFVPETSAVSAATATNGMLDRLHTAQCKRTVPFYCSSISDCAALMGVAMGLELSHKSSAFALCYKTLNGIQPSDLTQTQVDQLKRLGCNVYVARGYTHYLLENGTVSSEDRYDEILYVDKIANDLQDVAVSMLAENPDKMPQTDDSTAQFINRFSAVLMGYTDMGVLASSTWRGTSIGPINTGDVIENGFLMWADSYDNQSDADRAAHKAVPIQVALLLAGSIESIVITVNVQI